MKKTIINCTALVMVLLLSFSAFTPAYARGASEHRFKHTEVSAANEQKVLETRFLNMLNHNFVYNEAFDHAEDIVNNAVIALLDLRDGEDDSYISELYVRDFVFNMYGLRIDDFSGINADFPSREGFVYILPRGFSVFRHEIDSVSRNEDGSYTVVTSVTVDPHDDEPIKCKAVSLFVKNEESQFGWRIIYSNIAEDLAAV